ncbi:MAG: hypothetical protein ACOC24_05320 [Desulfovibrionales bacterium]
MRYACRTGLVAIFSLLVLVGCAPREQVELLRPGAMLAVSGFSQPQSPWEMMAGYPPVEGYKAPPEVLDRLDEILGEKLHQQEISFQGPNLTHQCEEIVLAELEGSRVSALEYWVRVGRCLPVDYVLVPHLLYWQERQGGEYSVEAPASVVLDLFLVDVRSGTLAKRFHFDERQTSLMENLLEAPKFFSRGAKWVSAEKLAEDGISEGVKELGL